MDTMQWYNDTPEQIATQLVVNLQVGLTSDDASLRINTYGTNTLARETPISAAKIFIQQFNSLVVWVLLIATIISFLLGEKIDAIAIFSIVLLNAIIGFSLEYRADRAMAALKKLTAPLARVIRDGQQQEVPATEIVPGDILILESGDLVAADARLIEAATLKINEAMLTGESLPVEKNLKICPINTELADRKNMVFMGTAVVQGTGKAVVVSTGMQSEMGKIAALLQTATTDETPLKKRLDQVAYRLIWLCLGIVVLIFALGIFWRSTSFLLLFMSAVSLAVAAIPEGLPAVVTVALALGVQRMARRKVLVRHLPAVETLGNLQVICTDKTGTLTVGEMTARKIVMSNGIYVIQGQGYSKAGNFTFNNNIVDVLTDQSLISLLTAITACNNAGIVMVNDTFTASGDPTEVALLIAAAKASIWHKDINAIQPRLHELPFDSTRKRMSVITQKNDTMIAYIKGAPEVIFERCTKLLTVNGIITLQHSDLEKMQQSCQWLAAEGMRVLAVAMRTLSMPEPFSQYSTDDIENDLVLLGLVGMQDPPHVDTSFAVSECKRAGIKPVMITGDHPETARAIAEEVGIYTPGDKVVTGKDIDSWTAKEFTDYVTEITVYARVTAEHKLKIVRAWKSKSMVVAMTGDGVNDAPALKEASVGIAMGKTGTAVTKEAADLIITDNNFSAIVAGIEEGRTIYDNIAKTLTYLLAGNTGEIIVMFVALLIGWPLPLLPIQLLWINLVTDGLPALALATDVAQADMLARPPRSSGTTFMNRAFFRRITMVGLLTASVTLGVFAYYYVVDNNLIQAQDSAFSVLVTAELIRAFGARSDDKPIWQLSIFSNMRLFFIISISFLAQVIIHHMVILQKVFGITTVSWQECVSWIVIGMIPFLILELGKGLRQKLKGNKM
jgi:Ca2+-transporting ATPase